MGRRDSVFTGWSMRVGRVLGIPIRIHFTFLLLLAWFGFASATQGGNAFVAILFLLLVFLCVVLHELGHAMAGRAFGVTTREIVLYPIGGIAYLERMPRGGAELLIALAGPAVNLVLASLLLILSAALGSTGPAAGGVLVTGGLLPNLVAVNLVLFVFNLIPAFPMDGGRVLRGALAMGMGEDRATMIAGGVGQVVAIVFGAVGLFGIPGLMPPNPILIFIALFVFLGAAQETAFHHRRAMVVGRPARQAMIRRFDVLAPQDTLGHAAELLLHTHQEDFPVVDAWHRLAGVLPRRILLASLARQGKDIPVLEVMERDVPVVSPDTDLAQVARHLRSHPGLPVIVMDQTGPVGMITLENLLEFTEVTRAAGAGDSSA